MVKVTDKQKEILYIINTKLKYNNILSSVVPSLAVQFVTANTKVEMGKVLIDIENYLISLHGK